jgi:hypothetical protein
MSNLRVTSLRGRTAGTAPTLPDGAVITGVTTSTNVSVGSSVTAAEFYGDGSGLTGLNVPSGFSELDAALFN